MIKKGFTLIELLVVIAIIAILAILITVNLSTARKKARDTQRKTQLTSIATGLQLYNDDKSSYPGSSTLAAGNTYSLTDSGFTLSSAGGATKYVDSFKVPAGTTSGATRGYAYTNTGTSSYTLTTDMETGGTFTCSEGGCK